MRGDTAPAARAAMSVNLPPVPQPPALVLAEAALQRQNALLGASRDTPLPAPSPSAAPAPAAAPAPLPPAPQVPDQVSLSAQARASLLASGPGVGEAGTPRQPGVAPGAAAHPSVPAPPSAPLSAPPGRPALPQGAAAPVLPPWPATGVGAPLRAMVTMLVQQLTAPVQPQRVLAVQPWPVALLPQVDGEHASPDLPPLQTWLVRQGVVQTEQGPRGFAITLRVPQPWLQAQPQAPTAAPAAATAGGAPLAAAFAGKPEALQSGTWALVLQPATPAAARASALLTLDFQPLAQPALYGRELLQARSDPWLLMAALQASGQLPKDEERVREHEAQLCQSHGCPYAGRAPCEQPFCLALRTVLPADAVDPQPPVA